jgi:predicted anti-sigma-YlaC factor YlaD
VTFAQAQRPIALALASVASVLLLAGAVPLGVALGVGAVVAAWVPGRSGAGDAGDD